MMKKLELYFKEIVYGKKKGFFVFLIKMVLLPLSWLYGLGICMRNRLYENGWMRRYTPPVPLVISVGNIVAGGTGKTPVTLMIANVFYERYFLAILSRGYRSRIEKLDTPVVLCEREGPTLPASYCGDESYLFAKRLPKAMVIVGGDRKKASFLAAKAGVQVILLDDALQHRRLARDFDVVVIDIGDPFGHGYYLPRGFLRDDISSLARAHLIVLNHFKDAEEFKKVKNQLSAYSKAPVIGTQGYVFAYRDLKGQIVIPEEDMSVAMFCSIARPEYFRHTLENEGFTIVDEYILADHDNIREDKLERFSDRCLKKNAKWLVCTEKDRVKLQDSLKVSLPILWVQLELRVVNGEEEWSDFLKEMESKIA